MLEKFDTDLINEMVEEGCPFTLSILHTLLGAIKLAKFKDNYNHLAELSGLCFRFSSEKIAEHRRLNNINLN